MAGWAAHLYGLGEMSVSVSGTFQGVRELVNTHRGAVVRRIATATAMSVGAAVVGLSVASAAAASTHEASSGTVIVTNRATDTQQRASYHSVWSSYGACAWRGQLGVDRGEWRSYGCANTGTGQYPWRLYVYN